MEGSERMKDYPRYAMQKVKSIYEQWMGSRSSLFFKMLSVLFFVVVNVTKRFI